MITWFYLFDDVTIVFVIWCNFVSWYECVLFARLYDCLLQYLIVLWYDNNGTMIWYDMIWWWRYYDIYKCIILNKIINMNIFILVCLLVRMYECNCIITNIISWKVYYILYNTIINIVL